MTVTADANRNAVILPNLTAGAHAAYREDAAELDRVLVTNDLSLVPTT